MLSVILTLTSALVATTSNGSFRPRYRMAHLRRIHGRAWPSCPGSVGSNHFRAGRFVP